MCCFFKLIVGVVYLRGWVFFFELGFGGLGWEMFWEVEVFLSGFVDWFFFFLDEEKFLNRDVWNRWEYGEGGYVILVLW